HYLITQSGKRLQFVPEEMAAWHAGESVWGDAVNINESSIGIELSNSCAEPYTAEQMSAVVRLASWIIQRHRIQPRNILAHSDIAPMRKGDPGTLFDWRGLAKRGIGLWPEVKTKPGGRELKKGD